MEKIKNIIHPGKAQDDQTLYGTGQTEGTTTGTTTGHKSGLAGEGSHLSSAHDTTGTSHNSGLTGNQTTHTGLGNTQNTGVSSGTSGVTTAGPHQSNLANKVDPTIDSDRSRGTTGTGIGNNQNTGYSNTQGAGIGNHTSSGTTTAGPHSSNIANRADPLVDSDLSGSRSTGNTTTNQSSGHHIGRDSAAVGSAGLAAEGVHNHRENEHGISSNTGGTSTNPSGLSSYHTGTTGAGVSGPHTTDTANQLDPSVNTRGSNLENSHHHSPQHGGGAEAADNHHSGHAGAKTAVGAGGVGLAEHERHQHQSERETGVGSSGLGHSTKASDHTTTSSTHQGATSALPGPAPNTAGPHKQDWLNKLDPRVNANPETQTTGSGPFKADAADYAHGASKSHDPSKGYTANPAHHGVKPDSSTTHSTNPAHHESSHVGRDSALAGGVGAAGYETEKHRHNKTDSGVAGVAPTSGHNTTGGHSSKLGHNTDSSLNPDHSKDHHYGKDAAVAGGVGGAAYGAEHKHDKDLTAAEREQKREHKHELKEEKHGHKESKGGLLSFLHRDKNKKYTPEEEAEFDRQEREHNHSHKGRDAALGGAAVGTGAYEADKHHNNQHTAGAHSHEANKPLPTAPGNHGIGTGAGTQNALAGDNTTSSHLGRDSAAVGGHEHSQHQGHNVPLAEKPRGADIGDKLHGVERNRGVTGASGFPGSEGFGSGTTSHTGVGHQTSGVTGTGNQTHLGRDAAVGTGGVGLAEHEHRKHEGVAGTHQHNTSSGLTGSGNQYDSTTSGSGLGSHTTGHNTTGLSSSGIGSENEYRKSDTTAGHQSGLPGNHATAGHSNIAGSSGLTGNPTAGSKVGDDRNRLHKEPPLSHPAAQGGVPASGTERERLVGQGERSLEDDTGVANSHAGGGVNAASNY